MQPLSQAQTLQLIEALVGERREPGAAVPPPAGSEPTQAPERALVGLGDVLFAQMGGQPLYLLETLKLLRERQWLVPQLGRDGIWRLEPTREMAAALAQQRSRRELLPPSVRAMFLARLAKLAPTARQLVMASAVLGNSASARLLWQLAELGTQDGLVWEDPKRALPHGQHALELARAIQDKELEAGSLSSLGWIHLRRGDFQEAKDCVEASLALYAVQGNEQNTSRVLSLPSFAIGAPLTQPLTYRASEALCWANLAFAQVHAGQVRDSIYSGRRALALSQKSKNGWAYIYSTLSLAHGLLDAGAFEEALLLMQQTVAQARTLPPTIIFQRFLIALGKTYHAVQQWEETHRTFAEAEAVAETLDLGPLRVSALSQLCMYYAEAGEWEAAYHYALKAITVRKSSDVALLVLDFSRQYETEALLRGGDERLARAEVQRLGEVLGSNRRFRIPYLRSEALLSAWDGQREQAIGHLREAVQLAADLNLPDERWQIQAALGSLYQAGGEQEQAHTAFSEAARIIQGLAEGIGDKARRSHFLAGPQIHQVLQQAQDLTNEAPNFPP